MSRHRLLEFFQPLFSLGLELEVAIHAGHAEAPVEEPQARALALLEQARAQALAAGQPADRVESASFALVAWLDEILARRPAWHAGLPPLQVRLFNSNNAHTEFFHHLSSLQAEDDELREVYWHVLANGFRGQYYFENGDSGELGKLKALHARQLATPPLALEEIAREHITPQPYSVPDPPGPSKPEQRERTMLRGGLALALLLPLAMLLWLFVAHPPTAPTTLAQRVDLRLQAFACADLQATVTDSGMAEVRGFVSQAEDLQRVQREVSAVQGVRSTRVELAVRVWPYCEVVAMLKPYQMRNREKQWGLTVYSKTARNGQLREGDPVLLQLTQPNYDGFVWVDYFTADGSVLHFNAGRNPRRHAAAERIEIGADVPSSWLVSPPFGTVLVTVLASPTAFSENVDRPPFELASDYLLRLRESLSLHKDPERLIAEFEFLQTTER
ncbi:MULTISPECIES: DotU family type IV/VI secretion system protein [unclassified Variovorax]|uniref:DotU family type IV/VI secretion system protein n=1 Tax=unclassified Variovorax TaxID=663243 RepID=UPI001BD30D31|nr:MULTISPECIES: DotU family type IV/VI secretion system protein [unclassified Variovorax]